LGPGDGLVPHPDRFLLQPSLPASHRGRAGRTMVLGLQLGSWRTWSALSCLDTQASLLQVSCSEAAARAGLERRPVELLQAFRARSGRAVIRREPWRRRPDERRPRAGPTWGTNMADGEGAEAALGAAQSPPPGCCGGGRFLAPDCAPWFGQLLEHQVVAGCLRRGRAHGPPEVTARKGRMAAGGP